MNINYILQVLDAAFKPYSEDEVRAGLTLLMEHVRDKNLGERYKKHIVLKRSDTKCINLTNPVVNVNRDYLYEFIGCTPYAFIMNDANEVLEKIELDPDDFMLSVDGNTDINSFLKNGYDVEIMIKFPRRGYLYNVAENAKYFTNDPNKPAYNYEAFIGLNGEEYDAFYLGAYLASEIGDKLHSTTNTMPINDTQFDRLKQLAQNRGKGFQMMQAKQYNYLRNIFEFVYLEEILQRESYNNNAYKMSGYIDQKSLCLSGEYTNNGGMEQKTKIMINADGTVDRTPLKLFGLENIWGGLKQFMDHHRSLFKSDDIRMYFGLSYKTPIDEYLSSNTFPLSYMISPARHEDSLDLSEFGTRLSYYEISE